MKNLVAPSNFKNLSQGYQPITILANLIVAYYLAIIFISYELLQESLKLLPILIFILPFCYRKLEKNIKIYALLAFLFVLLASISNYLSIYAGKLDPGKDIKIWIFILPLSAAIFFSNPSIKKLFLFLLISLLAAQVPSIIDIYNNTDRGYNFHKSIIFWSYLSVLNYVIFFTIGLSLNSKKIHLLCVALAPLAVLPSLVSSTRGGVVLFIILLPFVIHSLLKRYPAKLIIPIALAIMIAIISFLPSYAPDTAKRFQQVQSNIYLYISGDNKTKAKTSLGSRFEIWKTGIRAFSKNPLLGIGSKGFENHFKQDELYSGYPKIIHYHSDYVGSLASFGLIGSIIFIITISFITIAIYKTKNTTIRIAYLALFSGYVLMSIIDQPFFTGRIATIYFIIISTYLLSLNNKNEKKPSAPKKLFNASNVSFY